jgi:hypothetical protein
LCRFPSILAKLFLAIDLALVVEVVGLHLFKVRGNGSTAAGTEVTRPVIASGTTNRSPPPTADAKPSRLVFSRVTPSAAHERATGHQWPADPDFRLVCSPAVGLFAGVWCWAKHGRQQGRENGGRQGEMLGPGAGQIHHRNAAGPVHGIGPKRDFDRADAGSVIIILEAKSTARAATQRCISVERLRVRGHRGVFLLVNAVMVASIARDR